MEWVLRGEGMVGGAAVMEESSESVESPRWKCKSHGFPFSRCEMHTKKGVWF